MYKKVYYWEFNIVIIIIIIIIIIFSIILFFSNFLHLKYWNGKLIKMS